MSKRSYVIEGIPRSGKNSQQILRAGNGRRFVRKSKAASKWLAEAEAQLLEQGAKRHHFAGKVRVTLTAYQRADICDLDNVICLVLDGLKDIAMGDDSEVVAIVAEKDIDRARPRVEITLEAA